MSVSAYSTRFNSITLSGQVLTADSGSLFLNGNPISGVGGGSSDTITSGKVALLSLTTYSGRPISATIPWASTLIPDTLSGQILTVNLSGDFTLKAPIHGVDGSKIEFRLKQSSAGGAQMTIDTGIIVPSSASFSSLVNMATFTGANLTSIALLEYHQPSSKWMMLSLVPGYQL